MKQKITDEGVNWIGRKYAEDILKNENAFLPTLAQIREGLAREAELQMRMAMGDIQDQKVVLEAIKNIRETWEKLLNIIKDIDQNKPLESCDRYDYDKVIKGGLCDPTSEIVALLTYIYQQESFVYKELNRANRFMDESKVPTLGPFACAFEEVILAA